MIVSFLKARFGMLDVTFLVAILGSCSMSEDAKYVLEGDFERPSVHRQTSRGLTSRSRRGRFT